MKSPTLGKAQKMQKKKVREACRRSPWPPAFDAAEGPAALLALSHSQRLFRSKLHLKMFRRIEN
jgi:hypothetical protein